METTKYEDALRELELTVRQMESGEPDIDEMAEKLRRAKQLIALCRDKLTRAEQEIATILDGQD